MPPDRLHLREIYKTSTFRLTVLLGIMFAAAVVVLLGLIYVLSARELTMRTDQILSHQARQLRNVPVEILPDLIEREIRQSTSGLNYYGLQARSGELIAGDLQLTGPFRFDQPHNIGAAGARHGPLRVMAIRATSGETILIARDIAPIVDLRHRVLMILTVSGFAIVTVILGAGFLLSLGPLRRVRDLQAASRDIAAGQLDRRMPVSRRGDELDLFAGTVNMMVEEVERAIAQVKGVTDAVAHDLRTPLSHVRGKLEKIALLAGAQENLADIARSATLDLDFVLDRFAALLRIAELEAGRRRAGFTTVSLVPLLTDLCDLYEPLAEDAGITLAVGDLSDVAIQADPQLLFEAMSNLIDNAIKFTGAGGHVMMSLALEPDAVVIAVQDNGPGLPAQEREAALRRFYRGADTATIPGSGLGLSVVSAIVHLHGFSLTLTDAEPGLMVKIRASR